MRVLMQDTGGEVLAVPEAGVAAMAALGWVRVGAHAGSPEPVEQAEPVPAAPGMPAPSASRGDWARYAESVGVDPGEMTKIEIRAAVESNDD